MLRLLRDAGVKKVNFVEGGSCKFPKMKSLLSCSYDLGLVVSVVLNGSNLSDVLDSRSKFINYVGFVVDSTNESIQQKLTQGSGDEVNKSLQMFDRVRDLGIGTKLNTVVTPYNWQEDMTWFVEKARPMRWKLFQSNNQIQDGGRLQSLSVSNGQFAQFMNINANQRPISQGTSNKSYITIDTQGRFFNNDYGQYSSPITQVGVQTALSQIALNRVQYGFYSRDDLYEWN
eukprot:TRINITY_DN12323_c0_g1_i1.p1 TRINITY_DN12323_c0_g1~~TRINITY_DN12323_c0_g1_i1.p1  ORF type:complete len:230 (+),score=7.33 TRINITY_DN12323_c0_g1_i1:222-911(+)